MIIFSQHFKRKQILGYVIYNFINKEREHLIFQPLLCIESQPIMVTGEEEIHNNMKKGMNMSYSSQKLTRFPESQDPTRWQYYSTALPSWFRVTGMILVNWLLGLLGIIICIKQRIK